MSIKLIVLKSGEDVIADIQELRERDDSESVFPVAYLLKRPYRVTFNNPTMLLESKNENISVSFFPYIPFSADKECLIMSDWVVTVVNPYSQLVKTYEEKINGLETGTPEATGVADLRG